MVAIDCLCALQVHTLGIFVKNAGDMFVFLASA